MHVFRGVANLEERIAINDGALTPQARPCMVLVAIKNANCSGVWDCEPSLALRLTPSLPLLAVQEFSLTASSGSLD